jgi:hypothetical protein
MMIGADGALIERRRQSGGGRKAERKAMSGLTADSAVKTTETRLTLLAKSRPTGRPACFGNTTVGPANLPASA